jgi:hypothetical protein
MEGQTMRRVLDLANSDIIFERAPAYNDWVAPEGGGADG